MKVIILIVASQGYQPMEYGIPKKVFEQSGVKVITASNKSGQAIAKDGSKTNVDITIDKINPKNYDGIFLIGGPGALDNLDNELVYSKMKEAAAANKVFGAICISPRILASAGLLKNKKATGWDDDGELAQVFKKYGVIKTNQDVVVDGNIITATGPRAAEQFAQAILNALKNKG
ncbi:DJ-1/PfpI family protein [Candidatus Dependentiae bacterium]|nr:DJ-1/PfpI family protein [Candidatus Dependentiae bacterium]